MMRYLLDTNACIALLNNSSPPLIERLRRHKPEDIGLPAPVAYELYYGAYKSRHVNRNLELLDRIGFEIVSFDASDARMAGAIRSELEAAGRPIGPYDLLIAGQARARGNGAGNGQQPGIPARQGARMRKTGRLRPGVWRDGQARCFKRSPRVRRTFKIPCTYTIPALHDRINLPMKKYLPALAALVLAGSACSPDAVENQDADAEGAGPSGDAAPAAVYDGVLFRRGNIVVSDLDRAYTLWIDLFGMEIDTENVPDADSLSYDLFNVPNTAPTRFATLNAGPGQPRPLGIYEVPGLLPDEQDRIRRGAVVINANGRLDAIRAALAWNGPEHAARENPRDRRSAGRHRNRLPRLGRQPHRPLRATGHANPLIRIPPRSSLLPGATGTE